jgi:RNA polymerase-binding transcription factor DksA
VTTSKKSTGKAAAKKATKKAAPAAKSTKAPKKTSKASPAKKTTAPAAKKTNKTTKKTTKKKATMKAATTTSRAAATTKKTTAAGKTPARKATAKKNVAQSKTSTGTGGSAPVIPPEYDYLHDEKWLAGQREALLRERASYTTSADRLAAEAAALMADREPGDVQFDEESGEGDTIAVERDRDLALSAAARQSVAEIDAALARLDNKTYGLCVAGDDIIPRERLEAIPEASVCVKHKTLMF